MLPTIRVKTDPSDHNPDGFIVINLADFNAEVHEPVDLADLEHVPVQQPRALTTSDVDEARASLERKHEEVKAMYAEVVSERERLDAQAAEQEVERVRLNELAAKLAEQEAEAKPLGIAALREELTARGIAFDQAAKKADLQALLDSAPKE